MLTTNASLTTGFESWWSRLPGDVWAKIATIGNARNASVTAPRDVEARDGRPSQLDVPPRFSPHELLPFLGRLDPRQEPVREHLRLPGLAQHAC